MDGNQEKKREKLLDYEVSELARKPLKRLALPENTGNEQDEFLEEDDSENSSGSSAEAMPGIIADSNGEITAQGITTKQSFKVKSTVVLEERTSIHKRKIQKPSKSTSVKGKNKAESIPKVTSSKTSGFFKAAVIVLLLSCLLFFVPLYTQHKNSIVVLNVTSIVSQLKLDFARQPKMSFSVIQSALKTVSKPGVSKTAIGKYADTSEPDAPAIILLLAAQGAEELTRRLGLKLAEAVSDSYIHISGADYTNKDGNSGKKEIDDRLKTLSNEAYDAVFVEDLHRIPGSIALMFHTYCDHENAPHKRRVYVMTVASESRIPKDSKGKFWDETVRNRLSRSWKDIDSDQMEPLLTRLTVGVAAITADTK